MAHRLDPARVLTLEELTAFVAAFLGDITTEALPTIQEQVPELADYYVEVPE